MTGVVRAVVSLGRRSDITADVVMNTFHFDVPGGSAPAAVANDWSLPVQNFYKTVQSNGIALQGWLHPSISTSAASAKTEWYFKQNLDALSDFGAPIRTDIWNLTNIGQGASPAQISCVLSYHGVIEGIPEESGLTRPRARRRGRLIFGPLAARSNLGSNVDAFANDGTTFESRLSNPMITTLSIAGNVLRQVIVSTASQWCVWSRSDQQLYPVTGGFVDDRGDVRRSRAPLATTRVVFG